MNNITDEELNRHACELAGWKYEERETVPGENELAWWQPDGKIHQTTQPHLLHHPNHAKHHRQ